MVEPFRLIGLIGTVTGAAVLAWFPWRHSLDRGLARLGFGVRWLGAVALLALFFDPGFFSGPATGRPLILLDNSVSMHRTGMPIDSIDAAARQRGDVVAFGELAPGIPGADSRLRSALDAAVAADRPVEVVTDGEIPDGKTIAPDLLALTTVRLVRSPRGPDIALGAVEIPTRIVVGDTLTVTVEVLVKGTPGIDTIPVELRGGDRVLLREVARGLHDGGRQFVRLHGTLPADLRGEQWLRIELRGEPDAEPLNDSRWAVLDILDTPRVIVVLASPDWDGKYLLQTMTSLSEGAVRGFLQLQPGAWFRADDLRPLPLTDVRAAATRADLVLVHGDTTPWRDVGRARLLWPVGQPPGDWYVAPGEISPLSAAFNGIDPESLPPLPAARDVGTGEWIGVTARRAKRGAAIPLIVGRTGERGRTVVFGGAGWYTWSFKGGEAEQAWRGMVAGAMDWLLASPPREPTSIVPVARVIAQGRPVEFRATSATIPGTLPVMIRGEAREWSDTLRFNAEGLAGLPLSVGRYQIHVGDEAPHDIRVEPWSPELLPAEVTLAPTEAEQSARGRRRSLRELGGLFAIAIAAFSVEWLIRRRLGLA